MSLLTKTRNSNPGFTLVELLAVIVLMGILLAAGLAALRGSPNEVRKTAMETLHATIEQARTHAITKRTHTALAIIDPDPQAGMGGNNTQRLAIFEVTSWPEDDTATLSTLGVNRIGRWRTFDRGVILIAGSGKNNLANPLDAQPMTLDIQGAEELQASVIVFTPRGGLRLPAGSGPIGLRLAEGNFRAGVPVPVERGGQIAESTLRIGRVIARPYRNDG